MPQSLSAIERSNPPPRRKSCAACIKAKRRCTLEFPACLRCAQRHLSCVYPEQRNLRRRAVNTASAQRSGPVLASDTLSPYWDPAGWGGQSPSGMQPSLRLAHPVPAPGPIIPPMSTACNIDGSMNPVLEVPHIPLNGPPQQCLPGLPEMSTLYSDPGPNKHVAVAISPAQASISATLSWVIRTRLQYAIDKTRNAPRQMVLENQTHFCHPCLYEQNMPRSMQDAFSSCALWMAKNAVNAEVVLRAIENRAQELAASPMPLDPLEIIARAQAMLLYQIIRIFDGDMQSMSSERGGADQALEDACFALMNHITVDTAVVTGSPNQSDDPSTFYPSPSCSDVSNPSSPATKRTTDLNANPNPHTNLTQSHRASFPPHSTQSPGGANHNPSVDIHLQAPATAPEPDLPLYPLDATRSFWQTWVFQESARRTVLTAGYFLTLRRMLRGEMPPVCGGRLVTAAARHSFTISTHLWGARDPLSFAIAWRTGRRWVVRNNNYAEVLSNARADDVDTFGKMMLTSEMGINETRGWLITAGGDL
ncbi:hypothetical protein VTK26DRAFT_8702 [Humicola hyalothermophila]